MRQLIERIIARVAAARGRCPGSRAAISGSAPGKPPMTRAAHRGNPAGAGHDRRSAAQPREKVRQRPAVRRLALRALMLALVAALGVPSAGSANVLVGS